MAKIWTRLAESIFYDDNHFATHATILYIFTQPLRHDQDVIQGWFLSGILQVFKSEFTFCETSWPIKAKEPKLPYLSITGRRVEEMDSCLSQDY